MQLRPALITPALRCLLEQADLDASDISDNPTLHFYGAYDAERLVGVIGLEYFGNNALLRSLAIEPALRGTGLGKQLVLYAEQQAQAANTAHLFLLTETAVDFFRHLHYRCRERHQAPAAIAQSAQFALLCPASATFMSKDLCR